MGTGNIIDFSAAFLFEVRELNSPRVAHELQIGGTKWKFKQDSRRAQRIVGSHLRRRKV
jgi:hypothetical protein